MRLQKRCFTLVISLFLAAALLIQGQPSLAAELSEQTSVETEEVQEELAGEPEEEQELSEEITGEEGQDAGEDADQEDLELEEYLEMARTELKEITAQDVVMALVYLCDSYQVRKTADAEGGLRQHPYRYYRRDHRYGRGCRLAALVPGFPFLEGYFLYRLHTDGIPGLFQ